MDEALEQIFKPDLPPDTQKGEQVAAEGMRFDAGRSKPKVLLGVSGSVAAIKTGEIVAQLREFAEVKVVATGPSRHFLSTLPDATQASLGPVLGDEDEWHQWKRVGDPVIHIDLRRWADVFIIAPLSANTLAKMAAGLSDNLLTCVVRAWDFEKPLLVAPAMNTFMWSSPFTSQHLSVLTGLGVQVIDPVEKTLACGDVGQGAMAHVPTIVGRVLQALLLRYPHLTEQSL